LGGPAKVTKSVGGLTVTPTGLLAGLRDVIVPPRGSDPFAAKSPVPLPGTFHPGGPAGTDGQGVCVGTTGGQKLSVFAVKPAGGVPSVNVNTPVQVAVPFIGIAIAGTDSARNAPVAKPLNQSFFTMVCICG
jgi:hypothetical protein